MGERSEAERLKALAAYDILDTPPEEVFDALTRAAARALGAPMAAVSLIDEHRQWFKARVGLNPSETPRDQSFCAHAIAADELMVVTDALEDPRFATNPLVLEEPHLRFYAGAPIHSEDGVPLGALCVLDDKPRSAGLTPEQRAVLQVLSEQVSAQLAMRRRVVQVREQARQDLAEEQRSSRDRLDAERTEAALALAHQSVHEGRLLRALDVGAVGWWEWDIKTDRVIGNIELARDFSLDPADMGEGLPIADFLAALHPQDREPLADAIAEAVRTGLPFREEYRLLRPGGGVLWVSARGRCLYDAEGKPETFPGVVIDITDRKLAEDRLREADTGRELAMRSAQLGRWDHHPAAGQRYLDPRALQLFGLAAGQEQRSAQVLARVHPDDRARMDAALKASMDASRAGPFRQTFRVVDPESGVVRWLAATGQSQFSDGVCTRFLGVLADVTAEQVAAEHRRLLTGELNHRVKNTLALVLSLVVSSLRGPGEEQARDRVEQRLVALGRAHDLLTAENWSDASVPAIVQGVFDTLPMLGARAEVLGPPLRLGPKPALHLAMALHELATNAIKYGALSNDTGRVRIAWSVEPWDSGRRFAFSWAERGGPPVTPPSRRGFGSRLVERVTAAEFGGESRIDYAPSGVVWSLSAPMAGLAELGRLSAEASPAEDRPLERV